MSRPAIVIPTLNPAEELIKLVDLLGKTCDFHEIIIVDDGSDAACNKIFETASKFPFCRILHHPRNLGKGAALKTAFRDYLSRHPDGIGCVTTDDDSQHTVEDIQRIAEAFESDPASLHLGCRDFNGSDVPWKSKFGNKLTRSLFRLLAGINIADTQTGLRAIPAEVMIDSLAIRGNRFEFETEMLLRVQKNDTSFREVPIQTVYHHNNRGTRFHPLVDSMRIYRVLFRHILHQLFRFLLSSISSALIDLLLFALLVHLFSGKVKQSALLLSGICIAARIISATWNYLVNRYWVFTVPPEKRVPLKKSLPRYALLCIFILAASCGLTCLLAKLVSVSALPYWKAGVDTVLFLLSFLIQKTAIFHSKSDAPA